MKYQIIYADPPWSYSDKGQSGSKKNSGAATHYDVMGAQDIKNLPVASIAEDDSLCFMWVTGPQLPVGLEVLEAWGFEFKTVAFTWVKTGGHINSIKTLMDFVKEEVLPRCGHNEDHPSFKKAFLNH